MRELSMKSQLNNDGNVEVVEIPNQETIDAIEELENGGGFSFTGNSEDLLREMIEELENSFKQNECDMEEVENEEK